MPQANQERSSGAVELSGAHVVIAGGSKGVGGALARELNRRGSRVTVMARESDSLQSLAKEIGGTAVPVDLTDLESLDGLIDRIESEEGPIDILVSNAATAKTGPFRETTARDLRNGIFTNFASHLELNRQVLPGMFGRGAGTLAIVGSVSAEVPMIHLGTYAPAKAGLVKFGIDLGNELRPSGIRVPVFILGSVPHTQLSVEGVKDPVIAFIDKMTGTIGVMTPEKVAKRIADVLATDRRSAVYAIPRMAAPLVQFRLLPQRLVDPLLVRPALKEAARLRRAG
jgi:short-subunit dehydrogenase